MNQERNRIKITELVTAGVAVLTLALSGITAIAAHNASVSAGRVQELFQGGDACRAIRTEISDLHQTGLKAYQIKKIMDIERPTSAVLQRDPNANAVTEADANCGKNGERPVEQWIKIISSVPVAAPGSR